ncbi:TetR/AcrR family transcriptional regulator [Acidovorax radicis]|uniref:TetR/AcrR family transcriptional regulator n=1 Tax=Acidovorax radicis TaxID=758826 RepID=UPI001CFB15F7|nr:TetR/AcrR family transcriptional regulator [Acidovorax radicis]UCU99672.1 TetR/AcrR family transcriptional regulator [Acidovorax radicis]
MTTELQPPTKHQILRCGERLIAARGFVGVGLAEILAAAGVPKGSFYHYFGSKERFGEALLAQYMERYLARLDLLLAPDAQGTPALDRLMRYWSYWNVSQCGIAPGDEGAEGVDDAAQAAAGARCLIVKLSAEVADMSEPMRLALRNGTDEIVQRIAACLHECQSEGSVPAHTAPAALALTLYELWLGASLLAKLRRDGSAFEHALQSTRQLLGAQAA